MTYIKSHLTAIGALIVTLLTTVQQHTGGGGLTRANLVTVAIAVLGVLLSYVLQNTDGGVRHYSQAIINTLVVIAQLVAPFVVDGRITYAQILVVLVTVVQTAAVFWQQDKTATVDRRDVDAGTTPVDVTTSARHDGDEPGAVQASTLLGRDRIVSSNGLDGTG